jgi:hypothetical protein
VDIHGPGDGGRIFITIWYEGCEKKHRKPESDIVQFEVEPPVFKLTLTGPGVGTSCIRRIHTVHLEATRVPQDTSHLGTDFPALQTIILMAKVLAEHVAHTMHPPELTENLEEELRSGKGDQAAQAQCVPKTTLTCALRCKLLCA